ncbi:MAG: signal peptidase I [Nostocoides sp.]
MTSEPEISPQAPSPRAARRARKPWPVWAHVILALVLVAVLRNFVAQSFYVPSGSMIPTLQVGDRVVVAKFGTDVRRGDIVVFDGTEIFGGGAREPWKGTLGQVASSIAGVFGINPGEKDYVKRVIGVGGDRIVCCDAAGRLTINGQSVTEPYLAAGESPSQTPFDVVVPPGRLFMMGDNRGNSADSRAHLGDPGGGMVPLADVIGSPLVRYWPLGRLDGMSSIGHSEDLARIPAGDGK